jgi:aminoglycoside phosphotransferase (APT) family kinase protein
MEAGSVAAAGLDAAVRDWLAATLGGVLTRSERAPARRQAWLIDSKDSDGHTDAWFLRIGVTGDPANDPEVLRRECRVMQTMHACAFPVPRVRAADHDLGVVLFERVEGSWQLHDEPADVQLAVYQHYAALLAALHRIDTTTLEREGVLARPASVRDCALSAVERAMRNRVEGHDDLLEEFALSWLRRNAPSGDVPLVLVHGDAGVGNFLFVRDRVSAVVDWEWAHIGDPMEDLAALNIHASFFPSGSMPAVIQQYESAGGAAVDLDRIRYYRVENMLRSVIVLRAISSRLDVRDNVGLNLAYRLLCERFLCDCLADALRIDLSPVELPKSLATYSLHEFVADTMRKLVVPDLAEGWTRSQAVAAAGLVEYLGRRERLRDSLANLERNELSALLGESIVDCEVARTRLRSALGLWAGHKNEAVLRYLAACAQREELLAAPLMDALPRVMLQPLVRVA